LDFVSSDRRVRAFKATDAFAVETYRVAASLSATAPSELVGAVRGVALRSGGALVAAAANARGGPAERRLLERARSELIEGRYYLYLLRRLGVLDAKRYRGLTSRQDVALRELEHLLQSASDAGHDGAP
jgi:four helix bundle protein